MDTKEFKKLFDEVAVAYNFKKAFGGWFKESHECIAVLDLQKSNYGNYFELNIKIYIQGIFGKTYNQCKNLVKKDTGDVFRRQPKEFNDVFNFELSMDNNRRKHKLEILFSGFVKPFIDKSLSCEGLKELAQQGEVFLLPAVKKELG